MPPMPWWFQVDTELGDIRILDYVICEDGGTLVNPMIVDGQIIGGTAQGIGTALYEEMPYDEMGQPLGSTLADYLLPVGHRGAGTAHRAYVDTIAAFDVWPKRHWRGRCDRAARRDRQRGE